MPRGNSGLPGSGLVIDSMAAAVWAHRGPAPLMERPHRHDDLEINIVLEGRLDYLFGATRLTVSVNEIALFWAATPHRLIDSLTPEPGDHCWVHIPLATVLAWGLSDEDLRSLLTDRPIVLPTGVVGRDLRSTFETWMVDLPGGDLQQPALLEVQALISRLLHHNAHRADPDHPPVDPDHLSGDAMMRHVVQMARFVVTSFRRPITASDVAGETHLHPTYAMTVFRRNMGMTLGNYLTRCRVAEAQRLLITTSLTTAEIGYASGFGSQSSFYGHFTRVCGCSPNAYRRSLR